MSNSSLWTSFSTAIETLARRVSDRAQRSDARPLPGRGSNSDAVIVIEAPSLDADHALQLLERLGREEVRHAFIDAIRGQWAVGVGVQSQFEGSANNETSDAPRFVGCRFDLTQPTAPEWSAFDNRTSTTPSVFVRRHGANASVEIGVVLSGADTGEPSLQRLLNRLQAAALALAKAKPSDGDPATCLKRTTTPTFFEWSKSVRSCLSAFETGAVDKVVLARRTHLTFDRAPDPVGVLRRWRAAESEGYAFLMENASEGVRSAFLGVSPELLWRQNGAVVELESVAGTRRRSLVDDEDRQLAQELLDDEKERREHAAVRDFIASTIPMTDGPQTPIVRKLRHVQHLVTPLVAPAPPRSTLEALAPTPAVCGVPRDRAFEMVAALEPFDRGYYAGGVGLRDGDVDTMAVGIRSLLVNDADAYVYAGAGLVAGSDPAREWREVATKERGAREALGLAPDDGPTVDGDAPVAAASKNPSHGVAA